MSFTDLAEYFCRVQICYVNDKYHYSFMNASHRPDSYSLMSLKVSGDGEMTVSVS